MTTVRIYKSDFADSRLIVRRRRQHGRPFGRGRKAWRTSSRIFWNENGDGWRTWRGRPVNVGQSGS